MKILAIDVGNTNTKFGVFSGLDLVHSDFAPTSRMLEASGWESIWNRVTKNADPALEISRIAYSIVVSELRSLLENWLSRHFPEIPVTSVCAGSYPFRIEYLTPETLGPDRLADALGGFRRYGGPLIVVDFGTAVTMNVIDLAGNFLGGIIAPGSRLMARALADGTSQLPTIHPEFPASPIGRSTQESIASAVTYGLVELVDGMIERISKELGTPIPAVATGGNGKVITELSKHITDYNPYLTLEGIVEFARGAEGRP